jgi:hypothetical protein
MAAKPTRPPTTIPTAQLAISSLAPAPIKGVIDVGSGVPADAAEPETTAVPKVVAAAVASAAALAVG